MQVTSAPSHHFAKKKKRAHDNDSSACLQLPPSLFNKIMRHQKWYDSKIHVHISPKFVYVNVASESSKCWRVQHGKCYDHATKNVLITCRLDSLSGEYVPICKTCHIFKTFYYDISSTYYLHHNYTDWNISRGSNSRMTSKKQVHFFGE